MDYRYEHFKKELLQEDAAFSHGPGPGDPLPDFDLPTVEGGRLRKRDLAGKPFVLIFASIT
ncbi:MAG: hypothetical protein NVS2B9_00580 [Myxococcales bacterium]